MTAETFVAHPFFVGYEVSDAGNVRSVDRIVTRSNGSTYLCKGRLLRPRKTFDGYLQVTLSIGGVQWTRLVHLLVFTAFKSEIPADHQVHHVNRSRSDNRLLNLECKPVKAHLSDHFMGERNPAAKLPEWQIPVIIERAQSESQAQIARSLGVSRSLICRIVKGERWGHVFTLDQLSELSF